MKRSWWHIVKHVLFGIHSPSLLFVGQCWCQRKGVTVEPMSEAEVWECIERSYQRNWGSFE
jgi:hypothetical protein